MILNKHNILVIILSILLIFSIFKGCSGVKPSTTSSFQQSIDSVNVVVKDLKNKQLVLDSILNIQLLKSDSLSMQISSTNTQITNVKKHYENKINIVRNFSDDELTKFFTDRYQ